LPSITATHEFVVPRSIPMTFPMVLIPFFLRQVGWALTAHQSKPPDIKCSRTRDGEPHIGGGVVAARTGRDVDPRKRLPLKDPIPLSPGSGGRRYAARDHDGARPRRAAKNVALERNRGLIYCRNRETVRICGPKPTPPGANDRSSRSSNGLNANPVDFS
jgi:hypothetical protein